FFFSIQMLFRSILMFMGTFEFSKPSLISMIWTYFITLVIIFNKYGNESPGANDNLSSVACIIQLSNEYKNNPLKHTELHFVVNDAEELGLYGAQEWYNRMKDEIDKENTFFIIYDTIGSSPLINLASFGIPPHKISRRFQSILKEAQNQFKIPRIKKMYLPIGAATDHVIFDRKGFDCLVISSLCGKVHTKKDSIEFIEEEPLLTAKKTGNAVIELIDSGFKIQE
ncbi:MAG: M28 family peptidase, partial [Promethearchaeota archaeon]